MFFKVPIRRSYYNDGYIKYIHARYQLLCAKRYSNFQKNEKLIDVKYPIYKFYYYIDCKMINILFRLNDVVAIDADSFYFANYHYFYGPLEDTVGLLWSNIVFFSDVSGFRIVASGFHHANGINSSPDGRSVHLRY